MDIHLLVPFFAKTLEEEQTNHGEFVRAIGQIDGLQEPEHLLTQYLGRTKDFDEERALRKRKGSFVRDGLVEITHNIKPVDRSKALILLIDGSLKIRPQSLLNIVRAFHERDVDVVIGYRPGHWAIDDKRRLIETFENYLVGERFHYDLPDAQCGCWGIRASALKRLALTATSYEIEIELVIATLEQRLRFAYAEVEIDHDRIRATGLSTQFNERDHEPKLQFIAERLGYSAAVLRGLMTQFEDEQHAELPDSYKTLVRGTVIDFHHRTVPVVRADS